MAPVPTALHMLTGLLLCVLFLLYALSSFLMLLPATALMRC
jgi:hypothetical protein